MLLEKLQSDSIEALKIGNKQKLSVLRMLISEVKNSQIDIVAAGKELTDDDALKVLAKELKKRKDSIEAYSKAGRTDLSEAEEAEAKIIGEYLPSQMTESEIEKIASDVIAEGASDFGAVMKATMAKVQGRADGKIVSEAVKKLLS
ncbi:glutamyl-tRNA amidotransferase [candidate division WWE3 bacterium CG_4_9_14_0_2_um_filter_35_11]|uniref:Glutamyl-tRNA amidotransferase n=1 Tax=candidate division WWE3 bacterium CG_4_9_14_0_2_um_filter_35_11 TaxID=1975077 RepID=A0A2M8EM51_UNCKA|nr:MAG: glutamyl-tRNA amidotransferase [candidate division WWE3 bacterium CG10_big_fil_rev_8_21_14_0_10_35_32]PJC23826.1 MAG: glutamyl-tRNA amidotransferase [candidate division WWE3 bacterium CG_4_9_14_0_2_um_filter_35_11]